MTTLPWCCIAPAAFAVSGVAMAGIGTALQSAMPVFLVLSAGLLGRSLYLALVKRQGPGQFERPTDLDFDSDGRIYVVDFGNNRIQVFAPIPARQR